MQFRIIPSERSEEISTARQRLMQQGLELPPEKAPSEKFDSNCITPVSIQEPAIT